jgi:hypothetical protein
MASRKSHTLTDNIEQWFLTVFGSRHIEQFNISRGKLFKGNFPFVFQKSINFPSKPTRELYLGFRKFKEPCLSSK